MSLGIAIALGVCGRSSSAAAFTPASRGASLLLWLRADQGTGVVNGGNILTWNDISGNADVFTNTGVTPTVLNTPYANLGNQAAAVFDASGSNFLTQTSGPLGTVAQPSTTYMFLYVASTAAQNFTDGTVNRQILGVTAGNYFGYAGSFVQGGTAAIGAHAFCFISNGASSALYVDSSSAAVASGAGGANTFTSPHIGGASGGIISGAVAEYLIMSGSDSPAQRGQMFAYAATRYGKAWA